MMCGLVIPFLAALLAVAPAVAQTGGAPANPHGNADLDCASCHAEAVGPDDQVGRGFDHATTGFLLEGAHARAQCRDCHDDPAFNRVGTACADCHADAHRGRLGPACDQCHTPFAWLDRADQRRRHDGTALPLVGAHAAVDCEACHGDPVGSQYVGTPTDCYACHAATWAATTNPPHEASGFGTDCVRCHGVYATGWSDGDFRHPASFPLTDGHALPECSACHTGGFTGTPTDCVACHQDDYDRTTDPDHRAAQIPVDCRICHDTRTWDGADIDHARTAFPLTGAHRTVDCAQCHAGGYTGTPSDCVACHRGAYDGTTNPVHADAGFPTECATCHTTSAWQPSTWNHDVLFPIYSGRHRDQWDTCADCHVVPTNYAVFECIFCHEHNQNDTDADHREVGGYQYASSECFRCHPRGDN